MAVVHLAIEGKGAVEAAEALVASPDINGMWQPVEATKRECVQSVILNIILVSSGEKLSQEINSWYQRYKKAEADKRIDNVVLVANGKRLVVKNSTLDEIRNVIFAK